MVSGDFPGSPVVKTSPSNAGGVSSIPGQETKIPHASQPKNKNIKNRINIVTSSTKTLEMVHSKKKKSLKREHRTQSVLTLCTPWSLPGFSVMRFSQQVYRS